MFELATDTPAVSVFSPWGYFSVRPYTFEVVIMSPFSLDVLENHISLFLQPSVHFFQLLVISSSCTIFAFITVSIFPCFIFKICFCICIIVMNEFLFLHLSSSCSFDLMSCVYSISHSSSIENIESSSRVENNGMIWNTTFLNLQYLTHLYIPLFCLCGFPSLRFFSSFFFWQCLPCPKPK